MLNFDVDSEVFELTVAMLKQKSEEKYQELIELMFNKAEAELSEQSNHFTILNILILTMQVVDDALYKERFLNIILSEKEMIMSNTSTIHNLRLLSTVFESDENAYQRICDCYREEGMIYLFDNFERLFSVAEKFEQETKDNFFEYVFNEKIRYH